MSTDARATTPIDPRDRLATRKVKWLLPPVALLTVAALAAFARTLEALFGGPTWTSHTSLALAFATFAVAGQLVVLWRVWLAARYRPVASVSDERLPEVTVVVPAFNEGQQVYETLRSLVQSDYPKAKLHVIAVDDGSADDTWSWMALARARFGSQVTVVRCRQNRGKREALCEGFRRAKGEVLVTVDSDSEVRPDTLRNLVSPLVVNPQVGAVAGNVRVLNDDTLYGKMLDVSFTCAFEFLRAAESELDMVSCCPGALSAWRKSIVDDVVEEWRTMRFLGRPATIGEDRAMTNLVLRAGYLVKFQANALVFTEVPTTYKKLSRMLLRWKRSNVRESLRLGTFLFTDFRDGQVWGPRVSYLWSSFGLVLGGVLYVPWLLGLVAHPALVPLYFAGIVWGALLPAAVFTATRGSLWRALFAFPYGLYSAVCLGWLAPVGLVTPHRSSWMTRAQPKPLPVRASDPELVTASGR